MQPWHPAGYCRLCLSHWIFPTETDHHRSSSHDQWANNRHQSCEGAPRKVSESHRSSRSSIHNHTIWPWCHYDSYAKNLGEATHVQQTCSAERTLPHNHECTQDDRFWLCRDSCGGQNLVTNICLQSVLSEKNYAKSLWCLKAVSEGLERPLLTTFMDDLVQDSPHHTSNIAAISSLGTVCP